MKHLFSIAVLLSMFLLSCSDKPSDAIHNIKQEEAGWVVEKPGDKPVMKYEDYYQISPTWGQSVSYAKETGDFVISLILGLVCIVGSASLFYLKYKDSKLISESADKVVLYIALVLLVVGLYAVYSKPADIRFNNDKWVKKEVYDKAMREAGSTQPIWDSLKVNHFIIGGD